MSSAATTVRALSTRESLRKDLARLGVPTGGIVLVHSSLKAVGWIVGGALTVVQALSDVLGPDGTLIVPAYSGHNRDPSRWESPRIPAHWWESTRDAIPGFDPARTPSYGVGRLAEFVRTLPGARRSDHPQTSFAGIGPAAARLLADHELTAPLGDRSPLGRLARAGGYALLLGVGYDKCTAFHLAEYHQPDPPIQHNACAVLTADGRAWVEYSTVALNDGDFPRLGADFEKHGGLVTTGTVGEAQARLLPIAPAVRFAEHWLVNRTIGPASIFP